MKRKMYEIDESIQKALEIAEEDAFLNDGVISEELASVLESLEIERDDKIEGVALYIKILNSESEAHKAEIDRLSKSKTSIDNSIKSYKEWLKMSLNCKKFKTIKTSISFRVNKSVNIIDQSLLDVCLISSKTINTPDKKMIKSWIDSGKHVEGAELIESTSITVK